MTRGRKPTPEDIRQWEAATQAVTPLGRRPAAPAPDAVGDTDAASAGKAPAGPAAAPGRPGPPPPSPPALNPIDRRTRLRLTRGAVAIDARIDLHGLRQAAAHARLARFLREAQAAGARLVLVITGKGRLPSEAGGEERGVLRRAVPLWLSSAELRPFVAGFDEAGPGHGGSGALYVRVRRKR